MRLFNHLASPCEGVPALKYGDVNTETSSPSEAKGLIVLNTINSISNEIYTNFFNIKLKQYQS